jgi:hypothetical protein
MGHDCSDLLLHLISREQKSNKAAVPSDPRDTSEARESRRNRIFFSSRHEYLLRAAVRWAQKDDLALKDALYKVEERWLAAKTQN